jgi:hypothetical protein
VVDLVARQSLPAEPDGPADARPLRKRRRPLLRRRQLQRPPDPRRFIWKNLSPTQSRWEQAFSTDGGKTWETNWTTDFTKAP